MKQQNKVVGNEDCVIRLTKTTVVEYKPNPEYYPKGSTPIDMARMDAQSDDSDYGVFSGNVGDMRETIQFEILRR